MVTNLCLYCNEPIPNPRPNKKFCSYPCRNNFHKEKNRAKSNIYKRIDKQLHHNHEILEKYYPYSEGEKGIPIDILFKEGFEPRVCLAPPGKIDSRVRALFTGFSYCYKYSYDIEKKEIIIYKFDTDRFWEVSKL